jgi:hypothetical protein
MDNVKQGISSMTAHFWGTFAAIEFAKNFQGTDQCAWFFLQYLTDTVIGLALTCLLSWGTIKLIGNINRGWSITWMTVGIYDHPRYKYAIWVLQILHWLSCTIIARMFCTFLLFESNLGTRNFLQWYSDIWGDEHRLRELSFTIIGVPFMMNTFQLLIQNAFLEGKSNLERQLLNEPLTNSVI